MSLPLEWHWRCIRQKASEAIKKLRGPIYYKAITEKRTQSSQALILSLPNELLFIIASFLTPDSAVCLALTCKDLLSVYASSSSSSSSPLLHSVFEHKELRFPRVLFDKWFQGHLSTRTNARNRLLLNLQNSKWAYCAMCLKLHPAKEFGRLRLMRAPKKRMCVDLESGGIVDVCPCVQLTVRGKSRLRKEVRRVSKLASGDASSSSVLDKGMMGKWIVDGSRHDGHGGRKPALMHKCMTDLPEAIVRITVEPFLSKGRLYLLTKYVINMHNLETSGLAPKTMSPILTCPHRSILGYAVNPIPETHKRRDCPRCGASFVTGMRSTDRKRCMVLILRDLGKTLSGSRAWKMQREVAYTVLNRRAWDDSGD